MDNGGPTPPGIRRGHRARRISACHPRRLVRGTGRGSIFSRRIHRPPVSSRIPRARLPAHPMTTQTDSPFVSVSCPRCGTIYCAAPGVPTTCPTCDQAGAPPVMPAPPQTLRPCPSCARPVSIRAHACPSCGHAFVAPPGQVTGNALACVLSLILPGLGQLTQGRTGVGFAFLASTLLWVVGIGIVFHILAAIEAWHYRPSRP